MLTPGDAVRLIGTNRIYKVVSIQTHYEGMRWETQWATLTPPQPATHSAHWPIAQLEKVEG